MTTGGERSRRGSRYFIPSLFLITLISFVTRVDRAQAQLSFDPLAPDEALTTEVPDSDLIGPDESIEMDREPVPLIKRHKSIDDAIGEKRYIEHPNAEKGLIRIDKNKVYYYKVPESAQKNAANFKIAFYEPTELSNPDDSSVGYANVYDEESMPLLLYEHEWQVGHRFGKWGWTLGTGLFFARGRGQFAVPQTTRPYTKYMLFVVPLSAGAIYRLHYWDKQFFVPFVGGGFDVMTFAERRDDEQNPTLGAAFGAAPAAHFYGGVAIKLGRGARAFIDLDREYGINRIWITAEYRQYVSLSDSFDFGGDAINGGFAAEF